jgi:H/ACA ribonucleoprotein complex subunit 4
MEGIVLVDKPAGITSGECVRRVKGILGAGKAGHSGALDRNATGVLLIALGESLDSMERLAGLDKGYEGIMHMHGDFQRRDLEKALKGFRGRIEQLPPRRSAVARRPRVREVYSLGIIRIQGRDVCFRARTQAGLYVRRLAEDIGRALGVKAHLKELRRTGIGPFTLKDCSGLEALGKGDVIPIEKILSRI